MKKTLLVEIEEDTGEYTVSTPDGMINFDILGQVIASILVEFFNPDDPLEANEEGLIDLNKIHKDKQDITPTETTKKPKIFN